MFVRLWNPWIPRGVVHGLWHTGLEDLVGDCLGLARFNSEHEVDEAGRGTVFEGIVRTQVQRPSHVCNSIFNVTNLVDQMFLDRLIGRVDLSGGE